MQVHFWNRLSEATNSQISIGETLKALPKTSASAEFRSFSKLTPLHSNIVHSVSSHARLGGISSGPKVTLSPSATSLNGNSNEKRASSADQVSINSSSSSQSGVIYKLAREQTKANSLKRNAYLAALRRGDGRIEDLEKDKENDVVNVRPIVNNLSQNLSAAKSRLTPSPVPIEFGNKDLKDETNQSAGFQLNNTVRVSQKDTQTLPHNKEIKSTSLLSDGEYNVQASQLPDDTPDLREMHAQMVKGNLISQSYFSPRSMNIFNHQTNPLLPQKTPFDILQDSIARDTEMVSRIKRLRLKNPRKKSGSNSQIFPLGAQLPVDTAGESVKLPKVSHRKRQNRGNPTLKYTKAAKAVDRMKQIKC